MAKSALSRRIRKLLEGFGAPSTGTLVSKMNKLNVKPKPEVIFGCGYWQRRFLSTEFATVHFVHIFLVLCMYICTTGD